MPPTPPPETSGSPSPWSQYALPVGLGLLSTAGQIFTNKSNRDSAREQMAFQERMSSTAAQRAVKDYIAAGLNPALAYGNTASSAGGASATIGDAVTPGISTAQAARQANQQMSIARQMAEADIELKRSQAATTRQQGQLAVVNQELDAWRTRSLIRENNFQAALQPFQARLMAADAILRELSIPGVRNDARLSEKMGMWRPAIGEFLSGARSIAPFLTPWTSPSAPTPSPRGPLFNINIPKK